VIWWNCLDKFDKYNKLNKYFKFIIILSKSSEKDWMNPVFNYIMVTYKSNGYKLVECDESDL